LPVKLPYDVLNSVNSLLEKSDEDEASLALAEKIFDELKARGLLGLGGDPSSSGAPGQVAPPFSVEDIRRWLLDPNSSLRQAVFNEQLRNQVLSKIATIGAKFGARVLHRVSSRLDGPLHNKQQQQDPAGSLLSGRKIVTSLASLSASSARTVAKALESAAGQSQPPATSSSAELIKID